MQIQGYAQCEVYIWQVFYLMRENDTGVDKLHDEILKHKTIEELFMKMTFLQL